MGEMRRTKKYGDVAVTCGKGPTISILEPVGEEAVEVHDKNTLGDEEVKKADGNHQRYPVD